MRKYILSLISLVLSMLSINAQTVSVDDVTIKAGETKVVSISLNNTQTNIVSFQLDLTLPDGITINKSGCALGSRITDADQELSIGKQPDGSIRLTSTSLALKPISGTSGEIVKLSLTAAKDAKGGTASIRNIRLATSNSVKFTPVDVTFKVNVPYTLTYMLDGKVYKTSTIVYGTSITPETAPTKEGYTFSGWSQIPKTMPAKDVVVAGTFVVNKYKLIYKVDGVEYKSYEIEYGKTIIPEAEPTKEGYTFSGWSEIPKTMPARDVVVTGTFGINFYKLTYMVDGKEYKTYSVTPGTTITPETAPTKEGYTFSGWSEIPKTMPANDLVITGTFSINSYTLTYMVDGEVYKTSTVVYGTVITPEPAPTKEGFTFSGWSEIPKTMPARDVVVTGTFGVNFFKLTYIVDGNAYKTYSVIPGTAITPEAEPTKEGYTFYEWIGLPKTMPNHDLEVSALFYMFGDVNTNEDVDVVDVVDIARFVVAKPSVKFREKLADLNRDNTVNIADAVTLVNYIAGDQNYVRAKTLSNLSYNYDQCQLQLLSAGQNALSLYLDGEADFTAFQFDVDVPEGTDISAIRFNGIRKDGHQLLYNKVDENRYRVTALSLSNAFFKGNMGELLQFSINGQVADDICVHDIHFVTKNGTGIAFDVLYVSGAETGVTNVNANENNDAIYDLQGRKLSKVQHGVKIVNGKKVVVK